MIDLNRYRIVDLSHEIVPGERRIDGRYLHGEPVRGRPVEAQEFFAYNARMHFLQAQTHTGTHAEALYKYADDGASLGEMPLELYLGEAAACNFTHKRTGEGVTADDLRAAGVKPGDIVLAWGDPTQEEWPHLTEEALDWLIEIKIKLLGIEHLHYSPPGTPLGPQDGDGRAILAGIAVVDALHGLDQITKPRVFFIALPAKIRRVTACWTRAIALEPIEG